MSRDNDLHIGIIPGSALGAELQNFTRRAIIGKCIGSWAR